jgi:lactate permease
LASINQRRPFATAIVRRETAGFGTPVAISAALLIGTGFPPLYAAGLTLIANTAPVAFDALGTPIITLARVTGLPEMELSAMAGRQLPFFSLIIPAWMVCTMSGWAGLRGVWPAVLVCGGSFAIVQFLISNFVGPSLTDVAGGVASMASLALMLRYWQPKEVWRFASRGRTAIPLRTSRHLLVSTCRAGKCYMLGHHG